MQFQGMTFVTHRMYGGGSLRMVDKNLTRKSTLRQNLGESLADLVVVGNGIQMGINPCGHNNGGCEQLCLFTGTRVQCRCHHARLAPDGTSCIGQTPYTHYWNVECSCCFSCLMVNLEIHIISILFINDQSVVSQPWDPYTPQYGNMGHGC